MGRPRPGNDVTAAMLGALGTLYAVLVAFTVIIVWEHYSDAGGAADREASQLGDLWRLAPGFETSDATRVNAALLAYGRSVVDREWPSMARGKSDPQTWRALDDLWRAYRGIVPRTPAQSAFYEESIRRLDALSDSRRARLQAVTTDVPSVMWAVLLLGGVAVIVVCFWFSTESMMLQTIMIGLLAVLIAANLYLIYDFDNPFDGWPRIGCDAMIQQLDRMR